MKVKKFDRKKFIEDLFASKGEEIMYKPCGYVFDCRTHKLVWMEYDNPIECISYTSKYGKYIVPEGMTAEHFKNSGIIEKPFKIKDNNVFQKYVKEWFELPVAIRKELLPLVSEYKYKWESTPFRFSDFKVLGDNTAKFEYNSILKENSIIKDQDDYEISISICNIDNARKIFDYIIQQSRRHFT